MSRSHPLDHDHRAAAQGAHPEYRPLISLVGVDGDGMAGAGCTLQDLLAAWKKLTAAAAGQETEVPDADEATWQHMQQEAAQELIHW